MSGTSSVGSVGWRQTNNFLSPALVQNNPCYIICLGICCLHCSAFYSYLNSSIKFTGIVLKNRFCWFKGKYLIKCLVKAIKVFIYPVGRIEFPTHRHVVNLCMKLQSQRLLKLCFHCYFRATFCKIYIAPGIAFNMQNKCFKNLI